MIDKVNFTNCVLCKACSNACPVEAIDFKKECFDFLYPSINLDKCIGCNKCEKVCPVITPNNSNSKKIAYAAKNTNENIRLDSTSGGAFDAIAKYVLDNDGYVSGAVFDKSFSVKHIVSDKFDDIKKMRGSKYSQSDINTVYKQIKCLLNEDKQVLFSGCPCQVAGLTKFLQKDYHNLITVDFVCHGIPSEKLLKTYIDFREKQYKSNLKSLKFRDKSLGWHNSCLIMEFENDKIYSNPITVDYFYYYFLGNIALKQSCYRCPTRDFKSNSDITLGDFWGAEEELKGIDDNKGLSALIINTDKGADLLSKTDLNTYEVDIEKIIKHNQNLIKSPKENSVRRDFYKLTNEIGYANAFKKYYKITSKERLKKKIRGYLRLVKHKLKGEDKPLY